MKKLLLVANVSKEHIRKFHIPFILKMKELGWWVDVACRMDAAIPECDHCYDLPCNRNPFDGGIRESIKILENLIQQNQYDVIHCNTITGSIIARIASKKIKKYVPMETKVIYTNHGMHFFKGAPLSRWILGYPMERALAPFTDVLITINEEDYKLAKKYLNKCGKIERIHGIGVDLSRFRKVSQSVDRRGVRCNLGLSETDYILTYVAEINANKNQGDLLKVFRIVYQTIPSAKLLLVGPEHDNGRLKRLAYEFGMADNVLFLGWREDIPELLSASDVYVASSKSEGLGLNIIEAMSCNLPVVAFKNRGHCEIIKDTKNGFLVEQGDCDGMARDVIALYRDSKLKTEIIRQAQKEICKYEIGNVLDEVISIYNKIDEEAMISNDKNIISDT